MTILKNVFARLATGVSVFVLFSSGPAHAQDGHCQSPVGRDFETVSPSGQGMAARRIIEYVDLLDKEKYDVRGLLILRDCKVVFERYKSGIGREYNHAIYSVTKSVSSTLVGALLFQGKLKTVDAYISELMPKPWGMPQESWNNAARITLRNVMQMSSGFDYKHDPAGNPIYDLKEDRFAFALGQKFVAEPGTRFNYSDADASITGAVIAAVADASLYSFAKVTLFEPLQMANYAWWFEDRTGRYPGGWGLRLRPMDMLKLGQLYLQRGEWNNQRIFDVSYPDLAWKAGPSERYALHWWTGRVKGCRSSSQMDLKGNAFTCFLRCM